MPCRRRQMARLMAGDNRRNMSGSLRPLIKEITEIDLGATAKWNAMRPHWPSV